MAIYLSFLQGCESLPQIRFQQLHHSVNSMKMQILEKIYHQSANSRLNTPFRRYKGIFLIKKRGEVFSVILRTRCSLRSDNLEANW